MIARLRHFLQDWINSLNQYPGAYLIALYAALIWILFIYYEPLDTQLWEILTTCGIVFPLMITGTLIAQINWDNNKRKRISQIIAFVVWIWFYLYLHSLDIFNETASVDRDAIFIVLSYVIAWFSILWGIVRSTNTKTILTRWWIKECLLNMLIAIVSSLILRWWISASIGSVDYLFDINIYYKRYQYIGVVSFCLIGVSILLTNLSTTKKVDNYPTIFRFFGLYIFLPLAVIYACILLSYGAKILFTQTWPKWLISWMVMGYTIRCTIVYFLTYPLENQSWIKKIHTWYFVSILVFLPLLIGAIYQRINQYGITEQRYLIVMIAVWIATVGIWSLIWSKKSFRLMIGWLLILAFSSAYTPRSASSVSFLNQTTRLENTLTKLNMRDWEKITPHFIDANNFTGDSMTWILLKNSSATIAYLASTHGISALEKYYSGSGFEGIRNANTWNIEKYFLKSWGISGDIISDGSYNNTITDIDYFGIYPNKDNNFITISLDWYKNMILITSWQYGIQWSGAITTEISWDNRDIITIIHNNKKSVVRLSDYYNQWYVLSKQQALFPSIDFDGGKIIVSSLNGSKNTTTNIYNIEYYDLMIFMK